MRYAIPSPPPFLQNEPPLHLFAKQSQKTTYSLQSPANSLFCKTKPIVTQPSFCKSNPTWEPRAPARALYPLLPLNYFLQNKANTPSKRSGLPDCAKRTHPPPFCKTNPTPKRPPSAFSLFCKTNPTVRKENFPPNFDLMLGLFHSTSPPASGGGGIRTHGTLLEFTGFQNRRIRPLCHSSGNFEFNARSQFGQNPRSLKPRFIGAPLLLLADTPIIIYSQARAADV